MIKGLIVSLLLLSISATAAFAQDARIAYSVVAPVNAGEPVKYFMTAPGGASDFCGKKNDNSETRFWVGAEFLLWWAKAAPVSVPLITGNNDPTTIAALNDPGTTILFGAGSGRNETLGAFRGGRLTAGGWIDESNVFGWEANVFLLERRGTFFNAASAGGAAPLVSIPFNSTQPFPFNPAGETSLNANGFPSNAAVNLNSRLWGVEAAGLLDLWSNTGFSWTALLGFRYLDLQENLNLTYTTFDAATAGANVVTDRFGTRNQFYGAQLGTRVGMNWGRWDAGAAVKLALGSSHQLLNISGNTTVTNGAFGSPTGTTPGGVFAEPSNIGQFNRNVFAVVPEVQLKVGFLLTPHIRPFIGYNFLYLSNVLRPGDQLDRNINPTQNSFFVPPGTLTGAAAPLAAFRSSDYWAQGIQFGVELRY